MRKFLTFFFAVAFASCGDGGNRNDNKTGQLDAQKEMYNAAADDAEMNTAIANARKALPDFYAAFNSGDTGKSDFALKLRFDVPGGKGIDGEHIWMGNIEMQHDSLFGVVANIPEYTKAVEAGQRIYIDTSRVSDWSYCDHGKMAGGYTIRVVYRHCSEAERKQLQSELNCIVE